jgi:NhaA family Na+:H+ antiporter
VRSAPRRLVHAVRRPIQAFLAIEAAGGILLLVATVVALVWANSPWRAGYEDLVHAHLSWAGGSLRLPGTVSHAVNDGLMALFFYVVGLEIKREWVTGELQDRRAAALPAMAALGGMVVPAILYALWNAGGAGSRGWGIPMATDIAFALGVLTVLGRRAPAPLQVFLLTLAIVDDIGAIVVIAIWYSSSIAWAWLAAAVAIAAAVAVARRLRVRAPALFLVLGLALWLCTYRSGVHATIAGVVMGLLTPALARTPDEEPPAERLEHLLHPWTGFLIVPVFALVNAGIELQRSALDPTNRVTAGVVVGLVVGKAVGIGGFAWLAIRLGLGVLPDGVRTVQLAGAALLAGIGFTVSLFVTGLAFGEGALATDAKVGVLVASVVAAAAGSAVLVIAGRDQTRPTSGGISVGT